MRRGFSADEYAGALDECRSGKLGAYGVTEPTGLTCVIEQGALAELIAQGESKDPAFLDLLRQMQGARDEIVVVMRNPFGVSHGLKQ